MFILEKKGSTPLPPKHPKIANQVANSGRQQEWKSGAREMAQWLRTLAAFAKDPGLVSNTYTVAHSHL